MKRKKLFFISSLIWISLTLIYALAVFILQKNQLAFMNPVRYSFAAVWFILFIFLLFQLFLFMLRMAKNKSTKKYKRILSGFSTAVILFAIVISCLFIPLFAAFSYCPEHIVEIDGQKMVASADGFVDPHITYYDYKNGLVRGNLPVTDKFYDDEFVGLE